MTLRYKEGKSTNMTKKYPLAIKLNLVAALLLRDSFVALIIKRQPQINRRLDSSSQLAIVIDKWQAAWEANNCIAKGHIIL